MDGQRGRKERVKGQRGNIFFPSTLPPSRLSPHVKDKPGGAAVWPSDCVRRLVVPHTGTPLITRAGLSLLDTKPPTHSAAYTRTCQHTNIMNTCISVNA